MYEIEKNVPHAKIDKNGKWNDLAKKMEPKDSVVVKNLVEAQALRAALKRNGHKTSVRAIKENGVTLSQRVWRMK